MSKKLLFAIIATICATTAFADTKTITTQDYVDNNFQTKIPATSVDVSIFEDEDGVVQRTLLATTDTTGTVSQMGVYQGYDGMTNDNLAYWGLDVDEYNKMNSVVPSFAQTFMQSEQNRKILNKIKQNEIPASGTMLYGVDDEGTPLMWKTAPKGHSGWLDNDVKGTGLVTKTNTAGIVGERQIIETADVANYGTGTATERQIQEISIPTMGAVMAAISANAPTLPTGTAGNVVTYNASGQIGGSVATYNGSTTYNASNDASKIAVMSAVQRKMTCARYIANADQTAENCLLWNVPD